MTHPAPRIEPVAAPYPPELQAALDAIMPPGIPPLTLFTTLARAPRIFERFRAGALLDRGPITLRQREIVINRTCARCGCDYEWGVHVALFAARAGLTDSQIEATVWSDAASEAWDSGESLLIRLVDELHDEATVSEELWADLSRTFSVEQILEFIALVGFYHTVSFFANGLKLLREPFAREAPRRPDPPT
jgi:alkylhydroperoxidase family enzyme